MQRTLVGLVLIGVIGCTHLGLTKHAVLTTTTVMDIQYGSVLGNLAMMSAHPEALPNHVHLADGVVQINDRLGLGQSGGFTTVAPPSFGIERFGPSSQRQITEQWGTDATTDPERLYDLQSLYRVALGQSPLPPPVAIAFLREREGAEQEASAGAGSNVGNAAEASSGPTGTKPGTASAGGGGSTLSANAALGSDDGRRVPLEILLADVPVPGWFCLGGKHDVPDHACYVGHWRGRYAWVTQRGMPDLARFTATALMVIKLKPGERRGSQAGLAVTGGN